MTLVLLFHNYNVFWAFQIISSVISILTFLIFGVLVPICKGSEKLSSYKSGIELLQDARLQFQIHYYMFALILVIVF